MTEPPRTTDPARSATDEPATGRNLRPVRDAERPDPLATAWTADRLMATDFPEPKWAVPGIIPEGVSLFAGPPKVGKSWASLGLGIEIASGGTAFGSVAVQRGPVLYLALEDTARRLKSRMHKILAGRDAPSGLTLATACPPLTSGGTDAIARWLDRNRSARMVVIDVFAKIRGVPPPGLSAYEADYAAVGHVKKLADAYGIAIVLVCHLRKAAADDYLNEVSGTNGFAGAADTTLVLKRGRGEADGVLHGTGRDVDEIEKALRFEPDTGTWRLLDGPASDHTIGATRATVLRWVRDHPGSPPRAIADGTGLDYDTVKQTARRMADDGQLARAGGGRYIDPTATADPA